MTLRPAAGAALGVVLALAACRQFGGTGHPDRHSVFSSLPPRADARLLATRSWTNDEGFVQHLELHARASDGRRFYLHRAHVSVCGTLEGHCRPHRFELAFDETGACRGFAVPRHWPFTKSDHDPFTADDYRQLDAILRDPVHPLGDLPPPRGAGKMRTEGNVGIDGVSGATLSYYADHTVPKAFYTAHAVWFAAHRQLPPLVQQWTLAWVQPADARNWAAQGDGLAVWWLVDRLEDSAIPPAEAADLAYEFLAATDPRVPGPAQRYLQRTAAPFRPTQSGADRYASLSEEVRREFLDWWGAAGFGTDELDAALRADLATRTGPSTPTATALLRYLERTGRVTRDPAAWRPALAAFAAGSQSTYLRDKARRLLGPAPDASPRS